MPSMMIHLLTAHKVNEDATTLFLIGNIAPDAVNTRERKDITHFRTSHDRETNLYTLSNGIITNNNFDEGVLLHLYLDWWWDRKVFSNFKEKYNSDDWFSMYRHEIAVASSWLFHNKKWVETTWQSILSCPITQYGKTPGVSSQELSAFLNRNYKWHIENNIGPSEIYSPNFVEEFTDMVSNEYIKFRSTTSHMGA